MTRCRAAILLRHQLHRAAARYDGAVIGEIHCSGGAASIVRSNVKIHRWSVKIHRRRERNRLVELRRVLGGGDLRGGRDAPIDDYLVREAAPVKAQVRSVSTLNGLIQTDYRNVEGWPAGHRASEKDAHGVRAVIHSSYVRNTIAIKISYRDADITPAVRLLRLEGAVALAQQHTDRSILPTAYR